MATKEDILEQLIEEYLTHKGYFVRHNIKYLPRRDHPDFVSNQDSNHSDIDVLAINPLLDSQIRGQIRPNPKSGPKSKSGDALLVFGY